MPVQRISYVVLAAVAALIMLVCPPPATARAPGRTLAAPLVPTPLVPAPPVPAPPVPAPPGGAGARVWPVGTRPAIPRGWEPPAVRWARGHRGVDLAAAPGTPVRAAAGGVVSFAGTVAGRGVVDVELPGTGDPPLRATYEPVRAGVRRGDRVAAGDVL
ncbi:M23 family metallopeptidase, partial [Streptomyces sp. URMC 126]|uniref:M23 family metallopeptidase n=1 Tax=Streptomyces sp. URMC 126 TaxID=3423401 RepID=UPI003F1CDCB8